MRELEGVWWTINHEKVPGKLIITDENKISLILYDRLYDSNIICGFAQGEKITLVDVKLDRTNIYISDIYRDEDKISNKINKTDEKTELKYSTYKYISEIAIFGHTYERKGEIRLEEVSLDYTNLDKWVDWEVKLPKVKSEKEDISLKIKRPKQKIIKTENFDLIIRNPYTIKNTPYNVIIKNKVEIAIQNLKNISIRTIEGIIQCIRLFLILCMGDNINVEKIKAEDFFGRQIEIIFGYGKRNYKNRSIFKNIIKYKDIEKNLDDIIIKWLKVYEENELLLTNFVKLQTTEDLLVSEYMNLMSAVDSLNLLITHKEQSKESFAEIVEKLLKETNFIMNLSEKEIKDLSIKIKDIRRYFIHSNKTQKKMVNSNLSIIDSIMSILIESIRCRIMIEIGIDKNKIKKYYKSIDKLENVKYDIINDINVEEEKISEKETAGGKIMNPLSKKDKDNIAELNAMMGTRYRETEFDLENTKDLIEAVEKTTAEYMDYSHYSSELDWIIENYDQSLEVFHPEEWISILKEEEEWSIGETVSSLNEAARNMTRLERDAEEKCREIWQYMLLGNNKEAQKYFVGSISKYQKEDLLESINNVIENVYKIDYKNQIQQDAENFSKEIKKYLKKKIPIDKNK